MSKAAELAKQMQNGHTQIGGKVQRQDRFCLNVEHAQDFNFH